MKVETGDGGGRNEGKRLERGEIREDAVTCVIVFSFNISPCWISVCLFVAVVSQTLI